MNFQFPPVNFRLEQDKSCKTEKVLGLLKNNADWLLFLTGCMWINEFDRFPIKRKTFRGLYHFVPRVSWIS